MKNILIAIVFLFCISTQTSAQYQQYYQLRTYSVINDIQEATMDNYLENALLPGLEDQGIYDVGVFKEINPEPKDSIKKIFVLIPFLSLFQFETLDAQLSIDKNYRANAAAFLSAIHDNPPYTRLESTLMKAFEGMPTLFASTVGGDREERVYELRSYEAATETLFKSKVDMFNNGGEIELFKELDFGAVFYAEVLSGPAMPNLMYMTTHKNMATRDANWKRFVDSPGWKAMSALPQYQNTVSHADIMLLYPTEYSGY